MHYIYRLGKPVCQGNDLDKLFDDFVRKHLKRNDIYVSLEIKNGCIENIQAFHAGTL